MNTETKLGGTFALPGTSLNLYRMGYGAMQLAGPGVWGLPPNIDEAVALLRDAVAAGVNTRKRICRRMLTSSFCRDSDSAESTNRGIRPPGYVPGLWLGLLPRRDGNYD
jgi:hypothetical protein